MAEDIRSFAASIQVPYLVHFTQAENLRSILQHGIVPIGQAVQAGITPFINDAQRFDRQPMATSMSIAFPNHRMFYRYRQDKSEATWVILAIKPEVVWANVCAFCQRNAADALVTDVPLRRRTTADAFMVLYDEIEGCRSRAEQKLKPYDPTHDQAEVLVFGIIKPELIFGVAFNSDAAKQRYAPLCESREILVHGNSSGFFGSRSYSREY